MTDRPPHLADYREPPVDEVVIAVQFPPISDLTEDLLREFWKTIRDEYPIAEHQPRLEGPIEASGPQQPFTLQLAGTGGIQPQGRLWMISDTDDFLVQAQNTRFIQNWRRRHAPYSHFEEVHDRFWNNFNRFQSFLEDQRIAVPVAQQVEVAYINWIPQVAMVDFLLPAAETVITIDGTKQTPEEQNWNAKYLLRDAEGIIVRLYVQCLPAIRPQSPETRGTQLGLIYRAAREDGLTGTEIADFIASGRVTIVETFTQITTPTMQQRWGRYK